MQILLLREIYSLVLHVYICNILCTKEKMIYLEMRNREQTSKIPLKLHIKKEQMEKATLEEKKI